ncbi:hypothetical protein [Candidatus Electronema sp. JM]|uniref:hypothetical protein n=1 Tax=Candidatus Electronema sp. JM TaxID=3401571 RepID=UPI003AA8C23E
MKIDQVDLITRVASQVLDILLMKYPTRTGLGLVLGSIFSFAVQLFAPALRSIKSMDFASSPWWGWLSLGVLVMHTPTVVSAFRQKPIGNDTVDQAMELIERGNLSKAEKRQQYRLLIEKVTNAAALKQEFQRELKDIEKSLAAEGKTP